MSETQAKSRKMHPLESQLREAALAYPEAHEDFPWGDRVVKVKKKVFVFMGVDASGKFGCSLKLPTSGMLVLDLPFASPTGYGLGKSGWVSIKTGGAEEPDLEMLLEWLRESYGAVAPKTLVKSLARPGSSTPRPARAKGKTRSAAGGKSAANADPPSAKARTKPRAKRAAER